MPVAGVPTWALALAALLLLAVAYWYYEEQSARGVARRSSRDTKRAVAGLGIGVVGIAGALTGALQGTATTVSSLGDVVAPATDVLVHVGLTVLGWLALRGNIQMSATAFVAVAVLTVLVGFMVGE